MHICIVKSLFQPYVYMYIFKNAQDSRCMLDCVISCISVVWEAYKKFGAGPPIASLAESQHEYVKLLKFRCYSTFCHSQNHCLHRQWLEDNRG